MKWLLIPALALALVGCSSYRSFIEDLNTREVNSCVEGNIVVGSILTGGNGSIHVITGTGGQKVSECPEVLRR